jgi:hypothetical protein
MKNKKEIINQKKFSAINNSRDEGIKQELSSHLFNLKRK